MTKVPRKPVTQARYDEVVQQRDAAVARLRRIKSVITLVDNGAYVVGWSTCGRCLSHITGCECPDGPTPPTYIERWMAEQPVEVAP